MDPSKQACSTSTHCCTEPRFPLYTCNHIRCMTSRHAAVQAPERPAATSHANGWVHAPHSSSAPLPLPNGQAASRLWRELAPQKLNAAAANDANTCSFWTMRKLARTSTLARLCRPSSKGCGSPKHPEPGFARACKPHLDLIHKTGCPVLGLLAGCCRLVLQHNNDNMYYLG